MWAVAATVIQDCRGNWTALISLGIPKLVRFHVTAQVPLQTGAEQSFYPMSDSGLFTTRFTFVRGSAVVRAGSKLLRSSKRGVPGQLRFHKIPMAKSEILHCGTYYLHK